MAFGFVDIVTGHRIETCKPRRRIVQLYQPVYLSALPYVVAQKNGQSPLILIGFIVGFFRTISVRQFSGRTRQRLCIQHLFAGHLSLVSSNRLQNTRKKQV